MIIAFISTYEYIKVKGDCQQEKIVIIICFVAIHMGGYLAIK